MLIEHTYLFAYLRLVINRNPLICYRCKLNWSGVLSRKTVIKPSSHDSLRKANYVLIATVFIPFPADNENILNSATLIPYLFSHDFACNFNWIVITSETRCRSSYHSCVNCIEPIKRTIQLLADNPKNPMDRELNNKRIRLRQLVKHDERYQLRTS